MDSKSRYQTTFYNKEKITSIANAVSQQLGRTLNNHEMDQLILTIKSGSEYDWHGVSDTAIEKRLVQLFMNTVARPRRRDIVDIHELMKVHVGTADKEPDYDKIYNVNEDGYPRTGVKDALKAMARQSGPAPPAPPVKVEVAKIDEIRLLRAVDEISNVRSVLGKTTKTEVQNIFNPTALNKTAYLFLDSKYRRLDRVDTTEISWTFSSSITTVQGSVNSSEEIRNVKTITCPIIRIPYKDGIVKNSYNRVTMLIKEMSSQSYLGQEGRRFHFIFDVEVDNNMINLYPLPDRKMGVFRFNKPIPQLDSFTISFANPLQPIKFDTDRTTAIIVNYNSNGSSVFKTPVVHNLLTGDTVFISGFTTGNPGVDRAVIDTVNSSDGHNVIVTAPDEFQIDEFDLSQLNAPIANLVVEVYLGSKRVFVPLELTYQFDME